MEAQLQHNRYAPALHNPAQKLNSLHLMYCKQLRNTCIALLHSVMQVAVSLFANTLELQLQL